MILLTWILVILHRKAQFYVLNRLLYLLNSHICSDSPLLLMVSLKFPQSLVVGSSPSLIMEQIYQSCPLSTKKRVLLIFARSI